MENEKSSYRQIIKSTSLFGGVQGFNILITVAKSKMIAILLGPAGMGFSGLLTATVDIMIALTNLGLNTSAVKEVAAAHSKDNLLYVSKVIKVVKILIFATGLVGAALTIAFSKLLSFATFGTEVYYLSFVALSISVWAAQTTAGRNVVLQGLRRLSLLAKSNVIGTILGFVISVPLYFVFKVDGIVPAIVITSIATLGVSWYFSSKVDLAEIDVSLKDLISSGKSMIKLGFMISLSSICSLGASYLIRIFIGRTGSMEDVGLYNAGFAIVGTYVGMIFTAMATDYYPRLASVADDKIESHQLINHQAEVGLLILSPIMCVFLIFVNLIVFILYSGDFSAINEMIRYAALGMYFKTMSWSMGFLLLAKGNSASFLGNEFVANAYLLALNVLGYHYLGLNGLGISFLVGYIIHFIQIYLVVNRTYGFSFNGGFFKFFLIQFMVGLGCFVVVEYFVAPYSYLMGCVFIAVALFFSYKTLDKKVDLSSVLASLKGKIK